MLEIALCQAIMRPQSQTCQQPDGGFRHHAASAGGQESVCCLLFNQGSSSPGHLRRCVGRLSECSSKGWHAVSGWRTLRASPNNLASRLATS
jgi:hypothetical protein